MADTPRKLGYGIVPKFVWLDYGTIIGPVGVALYAMLAGYTGSKRDCWPSIDKMAGKIGIDKRTARKYMGILREVGLVAVTLQPGRNSLYKLATSTLEVGTLDVPTYNVPTSDVPTGSDTQCTHTPPTQCTYNKNNNKIHIKDTQTGGGLFGDLPDEPKPEKPKPSKATIRQYEAEYREVITHYPGGKPVSNQGHYEDGYRNYATHRKQGSFTKDEAITYIQRYARFFEASGWDKDKIYYISNFFGVKGQAPPRYLKFTAEEETLPHRQHPNDKEEWDV